jgi:hypothetical protein
VPLGTDILIVYRIMMKIFGGIEIIPLFKIWDRNIGFDACLL